LEERGEERGEGGRKAPMMAENMGDFHDHTAGEMQR